MRQEAKALGIAVAAMLVLSGCSKLFGGGNVTEEVARTGGGAGNGGGGSGTPGNGFTGPPSSGSPGDPGFGDSFGPGWNVERANECSGPTNAGRRFDPNAAEDSLGPDGLLLGSQYYSPDLGFGFTGYACYTQSCYIQRYRSEFGGSVEKAGLTIRSVPIPGQTQPEFRFERVFTIRGAEIGRIAPADFRAFVEREFPNRVWSDDVVANWRGSALHAEYRENGEQVNEFLLVDDLEGLARIRFAYEIGNGSASDLVYEIFLNLWVDIRAPQLEKLAFEGDGTVVPGGALRLGWAISDDMYGVDIDATYQERPQRRLQDLTPANMYSWIGYIDAGASAGAVYSPAYAFPLTQLGTSRFIDTSAYGDKDHSYVMTVPASARPGDLTVGGLCFLDTYGHRTRITLVNEAGDTFAPEYRLAEGRWSDAIRANPSAVKIAVRSVADDSAVDTLAPSLRQAAYVDSVVETADDDLCLRLRVRDANPVARAAFELQASGQVLDLPVSCLDERAVTITRVEDDYQFCFRMSACYGADGAPLLPVSTPIELGKVALFDEAGNRNEFNRLPNGGLLPSFEIRP